MQTKITNKLIISFALFFLLLSGATSHAEECRTGIKSHKIVGETPTYVELEVTYCYAGEFGTGVYIGGELIAHNFPETETKRSYPVKKGENQIKFKISRLPGLTYSHQTQYIKLYIKTEPPERIQVATEMIKYIREWPKLTGKPDEFLATQLQDKVISAEWHLDDAFDSGRLDMAESAKRTIDEVLQIDNKYIPAYIQLARYFLVTDRNAKGPYEINDSAGVKKSEETLRKALKLDNDNNDVKIKLAYILTLQGKYAEADRLFKGLIDVYMQNYQLYTYYGIFLYRNKKTEEAINILNRTFEEVSHKYPEYNAKNIRAKTNSITVLKKVYKDKNDYDALEQLLLKAIEIFNANCYGNEYAEIRQYRHGDYEAGIRLLKPHELGRSICEKEENYVLAKSLYMKWAIENDESSYDKANLKNVDMSKVLHDFTKSKYTLPVIKKFVSKGYGLNTKNNNNISALGMCIRYNDINCVSILLENGANADEELNPEGVTPIIVAVAFENLELVKVLLKYNADVVRETKQGVSARSMAHSKNNLELKKLIDKPLRI